MTADIFVNSSVVALQRVTPDRFQVSRQVAAQVQNRSIHSQPIAVIVVEDQILEAYSSKGLTNIMNTLQG